MASKNQIVVHNPPKGTFQECIISGTPKPGTMMQLKAGVAPVNGIFTYEAYAPGTDGHRRAKAILREDKGQGRTIDDAYADGDRGFLYFPLPGEDILVLTLDVVGTGDDYVIGDRLIADTGTGKFIKTTGSPQEEPFTVIEDITDPTSDQHILVRTN